MKQWLDLFLPGPHGEWALGQEIDFQSAARLAVDLGFRGYGKTRPNPAVGALLVSRENKILGMGWHQKAGEPHAEIEALNHWLEQIGRTKIARNNDSWKIHFPKELLSGAKMFITLEPCSFAGKTPSCAELLSELPFSQITIAIKDPHPRVSGRGVQMLKNAGVSVRVLEDEGLEYEEITRAARALAEPFLIQQTKGRPFVSLKVATSLDGMMGLESGESQWITSNESRLFARFLRGSHEATLVGKNTILQDNPFLDARETIFQDEKRFLYVLDSKGEILTKPHLRIFSSYPKDRIFVVVDESQARSQMESSNLATLVRVNANTNTNTNANASVNSLAQVMNHLRQMNIQSLWIEGGSRVLSSALANGLGDRLWLFQGPHLIGGDHGLSWTKMWGVSSMKDRKTLKDLCHLRLGQDLLSTGLFGCEFWALSEV